MTPVTQLQDAARKINQLGLRSQAIGDDVLADYYRVIASALLTMSAELKRRQN